MPIAISATAYDVLWDRAGFGPHHPALSVPSAPYTPDEKVRRQSDTFAELAGAGLATDGAPHPDLREALRVLAGAEREFYGWITLDPRRQFGAVAAVVGAAAVLAVLDGDLVRLRPIRPDVAPEALVAQLPDSRPAPGRSISVPATAMTADGAPAKVHDDGDGFSGLSDPGADLDADRLARVLRESRSGAGQLYAATRDRFGRRHRCPHPLAYIDTERGRWLTVVEPNSRGEDWIVATPATPELLATKLRAAGAELTG